MRDDTTSRQTGQFAYFAAQAPQRMWPQGTSAVDFSGSKQIGHSSRSGVPDVPALTDYFVLFQRRFATEVFDHL